MAGGVPTLALADSAAHRNPTLAQGVTWLILTGLLAIGLAAHPSTTAILAVGAFQAAFLACAIWKLLLVHASNRPLPPNPVPEDWPAYTVLAALHDEAAVTPQLIRRLSRLDYPHDRLEGFLVLEAHDTATIVAAYATPRPDWLKILVCPPGMPRTKPRALNIALSRARGDLVTVYDAEDEPDAGQLREAAARFAADTTGKLACLQAPLRIRTARPGSRSPFLDRQFAVEYAAQFEVTLPGMARLGLPFPLGGTSNHFRVDVLRAIGGWDAHNVTEDADLGFRLWNRGWRLDVISSPTLEAPPGPLEYWLPQRVRWQKGYMQTWGVHTRRPWQLGLRGCVALVMTLGVGLAASAVHAMAAAWFSAAVLVAIVARITPATPLLALGVMALGGSAALLCGWIGSRRAGFDYRVAHMVQSPVYWGLTSLSLAHAVWRLIREPFTWDKTPHRPDTAGAAH